MKDSSYYSTKKIKYYNEILIFEDEINSEVILTDRIFLVEFLNVRELFYALSYKQIKIQDKKDPLIFELRFFLAL